MIKNESEYKEALKRLQNDKLVIEQKREQFKSMNLNNDQIKTLLEPEICFHQQLQDEVDWYNDVKTGHLMPLKSFTDIGKGLIALRIASGISQADLARALDISASAVSKDENNNYAGITVNRVQKIVEAIQEASKVQREIVISISSKEPVPA